MFLMQYIQVSSKYLKLRLGFAQVGLF